MNRNNPPRGVGLFSVHGDTQSDKERNNVYEDVSGSVVNSTLNKLSIIITCMGRLGGVVEHFWSCCASSRSVSGGERHSRFRNDPNPAKRLIHVLIFSARTSFLRLFFEIIHV